MALLTRLIERLAKLPPATHAAQRVERDVPMKSLSAFLKKECAAS